jgi:hypothetical protein
MVVDGAFSPVQPRASLCRAVDSQIKVNSADTVGTPYTAVLVWWYQRLSYVESRSMPERAVSGYWYLTGSDPSKW